MESRQSVEERTLDSSSISIEIYGSQLTSWRCPACYDAKRLLDENNLSYTFKDVILDKDDGFEYQLKTIDELAKRLNVRHRKFVYPQIFINGKHIGGLKQTKQHLEDKYGVF